jgi:hypothetical protein
MGCASSSTANAVDPPSAVIGGVPATIPKNETSTKNPLTVATAAAQNSSSSASLSSQQSPINSNPHQSSSPVKTTDIVTVTTSSEQSVLPSPTTATPLTPKSPTLETTNANEPHSTTPSSTSVTADISPVKEAVVTSSTSSTSLATTPRQVAAVAAPVSAEKVDEIPAIVSTVEESYDVVFSEVQAELEQVREMREDVAEALREIELAAIQEEEGSVEINDKSKAESSNEKSEKEGVKNANEIMAMSAALVELMELEEAEGDNLNAEEEKESVQQAVVSPTSSSSINTGIETTTDISKSSSSPSSSSPIREASVVQVTSPIPTSPEPIQSQSQELHMSTGASKSDTSSSPAKSTSTPTKKSSSVDVNSVVDQQELASPPRSSPPSTSSSQQQNLDPTPSSPPPSSSLSTSSSPLSLTSKALGSPGSRAEAVMKALNGRQPVPPEVKTAIDRSHALSTVHFMRFGRGDKAFLEGQLQIVTDSLSAASSASPEAITSSVYHLNGLPEIFVGLVVAQAFKHLAIEIASLVASGRATYENSLPYAFIDLQQRISDPKSATQACQSAEKGAVNCMISVFPYSVGGSSADKAVVSEAKPRTLQTQLIADMSRRLQDVKTEANSSDFVKYRDVLMTMVNNCSYSYESRVVKTLPEPQSVALRSRLVDQIIALATVPPESDIPSSPSPRLPPAYLPILKNSTSSALTSVLFSFASDHTESRRGIIHKTMASLFNKGTALCINIVGERVVTVWKKQVEAKVSMGVTALTKQTASKVPIDNVEIERIVKTIRMDLESFEAQQIETLYPIKLSPHMDDEMMLAFPDGQKMLAQLKTIIAEAIRTKLDKAAATAKATFQLHVENSPRRESKK